MQYQGTQTFHVPIEQLWPQLLDPTVLQQCIAGCERFEQVDERSYSSTVKVTIGPVSARFVSKMELCDVVAPQRCTLKFSGQGGVAGFGKGEARVTLTATDDGGTRLEWTADAQVGGKLAQIGSRLIEGTVRKMSDDFFNRFAAAVAPTPPVARVEATPAPLSAPPQAGIPVPGASATEPARPAPGGGMPATGLWAAGLVLTLAVLAAMAGAAGWVR